MVDTSGSTDPDHATAALMMTPTTQDVAMVSEFQTPLTGGVCSDAPSENPRSTGTGGVHHDVRILHLTQQLNVAMASNDQSIIDQAWQAINELQRNHATEREAAARAVQDANMHAAITSSQAQTVVQATRDQAAAHRAELERQANLVVDERSRSMQQTVANSERVAQQQIDAAAEAARQTQSQASQQLTFMHHRL